MKPSMDVKIISFILVLGIPVIGIYLALLGAELLDDTLMFVGIGLILLFPIIVAVNVLRSKKY